MITSVGVGVRGVRPVSVVGATVLLVGTLAGCGAGSPPPEAAPTVAGSSVAAAPGSLRLTESKSLPGGYRAESPATVRTDYPAGPQPAGYGSLVAKYTADSGGTLTVGGAWGTITDPEAVATSAIAAMHSPRDTWTVPMTDVEARDPYDAKGRLTCGVSSDWPLVTSVCLWVNHYTAGSVSFPAWIEGNPATLDQADAADRTRRIRDAMTVPK
ncbi:hypothetical protein [Kitasatospora sp. NPDC088346]|uniref:hypothetical protein n=1 Tax=Kitasatospora sp. NPDC088346 TaxID=3364073 RepID=UPI0037F42119